MKNSNRPKCKGHKKDGEPCPNIAAKGSGYCYSHLFWKLATQRWYKNIAFYGFLSGLVALYAATVGQREVEERIKNIENIQNKEYVTTHSKLIEKYPLGYRFFSILNEDTVVRFSEAAELQELIDERFRYINWKNIKVKVGEDRIYITFPDFSCYLIEVTSCTFAIQRKVGATFGTDCDPNTEMVVELLADRGKEEIIFVVGFRNIEHDIDIEYEAMSIMRHYPYMETIGAAGLALSDAEQKPFERFIMQFEEAKRKNKEGPPITYCIEVVYARSLFYLGEYRKAIQVYRAIIAKHRRDTYLLREFGVVLFHVGKLKEAESIFKGILNINGVVIGPYNPEIATDLINLGTVLLCTRNTRNLSGMENIFIRALEIDKKYFGPNSSLVARDLVCHAQFLIFSNRHPEAESRLNEALAIHEHLDPNSPELGVLLDNVAQFLCHVDKYSEAEALYWKALKIKETISEPNHPEVATTLIHLSRLYRDTKRYLEAESFLDKALDIYEKCFGANHFFVAKALHSKAMLKMANSDFKEAKFFAQKALDIFEMNFDPNNFYCSVERKLLEELRSINQGSDPNGR